MLKGITEIKYFNPPELLIGMDEPAAVRVKFEGRETWRALLDASCDLLGEGRPSPISQSYILGEGWASTLIEKPRMRTQPRGSFCYATVEAWKRVEEKVRHG
jgi:hypothetical protein